MPGFDSNHYVLEHGMSFLFILRPVNIGFHYYVSCFILVITDMAKQQEFCFEDVLIKCIFI